MLARVLIADDADFMRMILRNILEEAGHTVVGEADNGRDAAGLYEMLRPDITTLDITMPLMDGLTAASQILANHPDARIVMISAMGTKSHVSRANAMGINDFIVKPFQKEQVIKTMEDALK